MSLGALLLLLMILVLAGIVPVWPYSRTWGYIPASTTGLIILILIVLLIMGRI